VDNGVSTEERAPASLGVRLAQVLALDPQAPLVEFQGTWRTWGQLAATAEAVRAQVPAPGTRVGVLFRNRPAHLGFLAGLLLAGACVVTINPGRGEDRVRDDIARLDLRFIAGDPADLSAFLPDRTGYRTLAATDLGTPVEVAGDPADGGDLRPGVAVEMLTSGTTGPPKRVPLGYEMLIRVLLGAKFYERNAVVEARLRSGIAIVNAPLVHLSGVFRVLQCLYDGRSFCLLERFNVEEWADAVRRFKPRTASLVPTALRMVLDADLDPADLSSIRSVVSGTAPLAPEVAEEFQAKYGIPVLTSYAATEFGGGVAGWNLADHERYWTAKRGSVGRAHPGCDLRVVDQGTGQPVAADAEGLLEVQAHQFGTPDWVRTTDLARIDSDGFLWITGRADQVIIRGGFKIRPDDVRIVLERDPRVRAAAVSGHADPRLGEVPVAAVELRPDAGSVTPDELLDAAAKSLARYELPAQLRIVDALPRTPSGKADLMAVRELFTERRNP
jgi:acyl-CoA synthetase (AMP-forming)/AMP-acid ligase II